MHVLINIDVDDLGLAVRFYTRVFSLQVGHRFGDEGAELLGLDAPVYLLHKPAGATPAPGVPGRDYARHWTPVHLDFVVDNVDATVEAAIQAGAVLECPAQTHKWGRIAMLSDPFGHGLCILHFSEHGYDALDHLDDGEHS